MADFLNGGLPDMTLILQLPLPEQEIDYKLEGENADRFRTNFAGTPWIKVPRVLWEFTAEQVGLTYCSHPPAPVLLVHVLCTAVEVQSVQLQCVVVDGQCHSMTGQTGLLRSQLLL